MPWTWLAAIGGFVGFWLAAKPLAPAAFDYPKALIVPLAKWISAFMKWLVNEATFGLFSFTELTRFISAVLDVPYTLAAQPAVHRVSGRQRVFSQSRSCRHLSWIAVIGLVMPARTLARRQAAGAARPVPVSCSWPYSDSGTARW
jgi:glycine betaine/proline transport system permease protein